MKKNFKELERGNPEKVLVLLKHPVKKRLKKKIVNNGNLLNEAVINDYYAVVKRLFEIGANPNSKVDNKPYKHYKTNFFAAAFSPNPKILELFLKNKVNIHLTEDVHVFTDIFNVLSYETSIENKVEKLRMLVKYKLSLQRNYFFPPSNVYHFLMHKEQILSFWLMKRGFNFKGIADHYNKTTLLMHIFRIGHNIQYHSIPGLKYIVENSTNFCQKDRRRNSLFDIIEKTQNTISTEKLFKISKIYHDNKALVFIVASIRSKNSYLKLKI